MPVAATAPAATGGRQAAARAGLQRSGRNGRCTGALVAPFAFLGPGYDDALRDVYTTMAPEKVYRARGPTSALFDDAVADTGPLAQMIEGYANQKMFDAIAREYQKGRLLLIGTTHLDAQRPTTIWNIGAIAASGQNDVLRTCFVSQRGGVDYSLAHIGSDFSAPKTGECDQAYMRALYAYGFQESKDGRAWHKLPPGLERAAMPKRQQVLIWRRWNGVCQFSRSRPRQHQGEERGFCRAATASPAPEDHLRSGRSGSLRVRARPAPFGRCG